MSADISLNPISAPAEQISATPAKPPRLWPAMVLVGLFWIVHFVGPELEMPYFLRFLLSMAVPGLLALLYFGWWWALRRIRLADRLYGFVLILGPGPSSSRYATNPSVGLGWLWEACPSF
jgi:hypothetical protein